MKDIIFENASRGLCVVCSRKIMQNPKTKCLKCHQVCKPANIAPFPRGVKTMVLDVKSDYCNADVEFFGNITCSSLCHEEFVIASEKEFGIFKKVIDDTTNIAYKVPTRDIIEKGLTHAELPNYPIWED